jgi:hypothetical protein
MTAIDLETALPILLPKAIAWANEEAARGAATGESLTAAGEHVARSVGVAKSELIRVALVDALPMPTDATLRAAAVQAGLLGPHMAGLTLGHTVFVVHGHDTTRLLAHEFRHVFQYEQAGSIDAFLPVYLQQIVQLGYAECPLEIDARNHERHAQAARGSPKLFASQQA